MGAGLSTALRDRVEKEDQNKFFSHAPHFFAWNVDRVRLARERAIEILTKRNVELARVFRAAVKHRLKICEENGERIDPGARELLIWWAPPRLSFCDLYFNRREFHHVFHDFGYLLVPGHFLSLPTKMYDQFAAVEGTELEVREESFRRSQLRAVREFDEIARAMEEEEGRKFVWPFHPLDVAAHVIPGLGSDGRMVRAVEVFLLLGLCADGPIRPRLRLMFDLFSSECGDGRDWGETDESFLFPEDVEKKKVERKEGEEEEEDEKKLLMNMASFWQLCATLSAAFQRVGIRAPMLRRTAGTELRDRMKSGSGGGGGGGGGNFGVLDGGDGGRDPGRESPGLEWQWEDGDLDEGAEAIAAVLHAEEGMDGGGSRKPAVGPTTRKLRRAIMSKDDEDQTATPIATSAPKTVTIQEAVPAKPTPPAPPPPKLGMSKQASFRGLKRGASFRDVPAPAPPPPGQKAWTTAMRAFRSSRRLLRSDTASVGSSSHASPSADASSRSLALSSFRSNIQDAATSAPSPPPSLPSSSPPPLLSRGPMLANMGRSVRSNIHASMRSMATATSLADEEAENTPQLALYAAAALLFSAVRLGRERSHPSWRSGGNPLQRLTEKSTARGNMLRRQDSGVLAHLEAQAAEIGVNSEQIASGGASKEAKKAMLRAAIRSKHTKSSLRHGPAREALAHVAKEELSSASGKRNRRASVENRAQHRAARRRGSGMDPETLEVVARSGSSALFRGSLGFRPRRVLGCVAIDLDKDMFRPALSSPALSAIYERSLEADDARWLRPFSRDICAALSLQILSPPDEWAPQINSPRMASLDPRAVDRIRLRAAERSIIADAKRIRRERHRARLACLLWAEQERIQATRALGALPQGEELLGMGMLQVKGADRRVEFVPMESARAGALALHLHAQLGAEEVTFDTLARWVVTNPLSRAVVEACGTRLGPPGSFRRRGSLVRSGALLASKPALGARGLFASEKDAASFAHAAASGHEDPMAAAALQDPALAAKLLGLEGSKAGKEVDEAAAKREAFEEAQRSRLRAFRAVRELAAAAGISVEETRRLKMAFTRLAPPGVRGAPIVSRPEFHAIVSGVVGDALQQRYETAAKLVAEGLKVQALPWQDLRRGRRGPGASGAEVGSSAAARATILETLGILDASEADLNRETALAEATVQQPDAKKSRKQRTGSVDSQNDGQAVRRNSLSGTDEAKMGSAGGRGRNSNVGAVDRSGGRKGLLSLYAEPCEAALELYLHHERRHGGAFDSRAAAAVRDAAEAIFQAREAKTGVAAPRDKASMEILLGGESAREAEREAQASLKRREERLGPAAAYLAASDVLKAVHASVQRNRIDGDVRQTQALADDPSMGDSHQSSTSKPRSRRVSVSDAIVRSHPFSALGLPPPPSAERLLQLVDAAFVALDTTEDGTVDPLELLVALARVCHPDPRTRLQLLFDMYDVDGDGSLSVMETVGIIVSGRRDVAGTTPSAVRSRRRSIAQGRAQRRGSAVLGITGADESSSLASTGLAASLPSEILAFAAELARSLDRDGDGTVTRSELVQCLLDEPVLLEVFADSYADVDPVARQLWHAATASNAASKSSSPSEPSIPSSKPDYVPTAGVRLENEGGPAPPDPLKAVRMGARFDLRLLCVVTQEYAEVPPPKAIDSRTSSWSLPLLDRVIRPDAFQRLLRTEFFCPPDALPLVSRIYRAFDSDRDGNLDVRELFHGLIRATRGTLEDRARFLFRCFDADGSGALDTGEVYRMLLFSQAKKDLTSRDATMVMDLLDTNKDGSVSEEEFVDACLREGSALLHLLGRVFGRTGVFGSAWLSRDVLQEGMRHKDMVEAEKRNKPQKPNLADSPTSSDDLSPTGIASPSARKLIRVGSRAFGLQSILSRNSSVNGNDGDDDDSEEARQKREEAELQRKREEEVKKDRRAKMVQARWQQDPEGQVEAIRELSTFASRRLFRSREALNSSLQALKPQFERVEERRAIAERRAEVEARKEFVHRAMEAAAKGQRLGQSEFKPSAKSLLTNPSLASRIATPSDPKGRYTVDALSALLLHPNLPRSVQSLLPDHALHTLDKATAILHPQTKKTKSFSSTTTSFPTSKKHQLSKDKERFLTSLSPRGPTPIRTAAHSVLRSPIAHKRAVHKLAHRPGITFDSISPEKEIGELPFTPKHEAWDVSKAMLLLESPPESPIH